MRIKKEISKGMPHLTEDRRKQRIDCFGNLVSILPWFNSDVLHKLYINIFQELKEANTIQKETNERLDNYKVRAITCADFINSPQIKRIDLNVFEIVPKVKNLLRKEIKSPLLERIAEFMLMYIDACPDHILTNKYKEAYRIEANFILNPKAEANRILEHIAQQASREFLEDEKVSDSVNFYLNLVKSKTNSPNLMQSFQNLEHLANQEYSALTLAPEQAGKSFKISMPLHVKEEIVRKIKGEAPNENTKDSFRPNNVFVMSVGVDGTLQKSGPPPGNVKNAKTIGRLFSAFIPKEKLIDNQLILDHRAKKEEILKIWDSFLDRMVTGDYIVFYFSGNARTESFRDDTKISISKFSHNCLELYSNGYDQTESIAEDELLYFSKKVAHKGGKTIFILDTFNVNNQLDASFTRTDHDFYFNNELQKFEDSYESFLKGGEGLIWSISNHEYSQLGQVEGFTYALIKELHSGKMDTIELMNLNIENRLDIESTNREQEKVVTPISPKLMFIGIDFGGERFLEGVYKQNLVVESKEKLFRHYPVSEGEYWTEQDEISLTKFQKDNNINSFFVLDAETLTALDKVDLPTNWILVTGTGTKAEFEANPNQREAARLVAKELRRYNLGLITSGWPNVDQTVGEEFIELLQLDGIKPKGHIKIVTGDKKFLGNEVYKNAEVIELPQLSFDDATKEILSYADSIIVIGGRENVRKAIEMAMDLSIPIFPLGDTGEVAFQLSQELSYQTYIEEISNGAFNATDTTGPIHESIEAVFNAINEVEFIKKERDWMDLYKPILKNMVRIRKDSPQSSVGAQAPSDESFNGIIINRAYLLTTASAIANKEDVDQSMVVLNDKEQTPIYLDYKLFFSSRVDLGYTIVAIDNTSDISHLPSIQFEEELELVEKSNAGLLMLGLNINDTPIATASNIEVITTDYLFVAYQELGIERGGIIFDENGNVIAITQGVEDVPDAKGKAMKALRVDAIVKSLKELGLYEGIFEIDASM